jgi:hypothetical protein
MYFVFFHYHILCFIQYACSPLMLVSNLYSHFGGRPGGRRDVLRFLRVDYHDVSNLAGCCERLRLRRNSIPQSVATDAF